MQATHSAVTGSEYRNLPITALMESANNPRKRFDEKSLEELAASSRTQGILAPLLVRELDDRKYEVVAGARRFRAAKIAELESVPPESSNLRTPRPPKHVWSKTCNVKTSISLRKL